MPKVKVLKPKNTGNQIKAEVGHLVTFIDSTGKRQYDRIETISGGFIEGKKFDLTYIEFEICVWIDGMFPM